MAEEVGKEPGGWELYRGIERIEAAVSKVAQNSMTSQVFAIEKAAILAKVDAQGKEIGDLRTQAITDRQTIDANAKAAEDQRNRNRLFIYGIIAGPIAAAIVTFVASGGLTR